MRTIDRYLIREFIPSLFYCVLLFCVLFVVMDAFNNLDEFLKHSVPPPIIASYYLYSLPALLVQVIPVSLLVAVLYNLGNLSRHNEIMAMKASGASMVHILLPYLFTGLVFSFLLFVFNENVVPPSKLTSTAIYEGIIQSGKKDIRERAIKNVALVGSGYRMIFAREYEVLTQTLYDVVILEHDARRFLKSKLTAREARYENGRWVLRETMRYRMNRRGDLMNEPVYRATLDLNIPERPDDFIKEASQTDFMSARQLKEYLQHLGGGKKMIQRLWVDYHNKMAFPFVSFVVILIGAPLAMQTRRGSAMMGIGISFGLIVIYTMMSSMLLTLGKGGALPPVAAAWGTNFFFSAAGIYLIWKG